MCGGGCRYERSYQYVLQLHMLRDIEHALQLGSEAGGFTSDSVRTKMLEDQEEWSTRLAITPAKVNNLLNTFIVECEPRPLHGTVLSCSCLSIRFL